MANDRILTVVAKGQRFFSDAREKPWLPACAQEPGSTAKKLGSHMD